MGNISSLKELLQNVFRLAEPAVQLGPPGSAQNPLMLQFWTWDHLHPNLSWWQHFHDELPRLADMGFTQIWLPPPTKAMRPEGRGYDSYDLWDLGEFEQKGTTKTRWGTKEELIAACQAAKDFGIGILIDAVLNHKLGADRTEKFIAVPVDPENRLVTMGPPREIEGWTAFDFPGRAGKYSKLRWTQEHFTGVDWDQKTSSSSIFRIMGPGHKGWSSRVDNESGNLDYLFGADIDHRHPSVHQDLLNWGSWVINTTGAMGFRLDAVKHIDRRFIRDFIKFVQERSRNRLFIVSEVSSSYPALLPYVREFQGKSTFFDIPLHHNFRHASQQGSDYDIRSILNGTLVNSTPGAAVTFVDNHDTLPGRACESPVGSNFKVQAYALILLRGAGHPCVFYSDIYPNSEWYDADVARDVRLLIAARKAHAYGTTVDYLHDRNCIGFVRLGDASHSGCAVVLSNLPHESGHTVQTIRMYVGKEHAGRMYRSMLNPGFCVEIDAQGEGNFSCAPNNVQVWV